MRVQVAIESNKGILHRAFERVVEVKENDQYVYVIHKDEKGGALTTMFVRERVLAVDRYTEAEYQRLAGKEGKASGHPESELAIYLAANWPGPYEGCRSAEQWAIDVIEKLKVSLADRSETLIKARIEIANLKGEA